MEKLATLWLFCGLTALTSCGPKDDPGSSKARLLIEFHPSIKGTDTLWMDTWFRNPKQQRVKLERALLYLSPIELIQKNSGRRQISDVLLADLAQSNVPGKSGTQTWTFEVEPGNYTGIALGLGVHKGLNHTDPAQYPPSHPLSVQQNTHWSWDPGYRFLMLDGRVDSSTADTFAGQDVFSYHTGTDTLYRDTLIALNLDLQPGQQKTIRLALLVNSILAGPGDTIDMVREPSTHTLGNFELAERLTRHYKNSWMLKP